MSDAEDDVFAQRIRQATKQQIRLAEVGKDALATRKARQTEFLAGFHDKVANVIAPVMEEAKQHISSQSAMHRVPTILRFEEKAIIRLVLPPEPGKRPNLAFQADAEKLRVLVRESIGDAPWDETPVIVELSLEAIERPAVREYVASFIERAFS